jgi:hypothetical protein
MATTTTQPVLNRIQQHLPVAPALPSNHTEREDTYTNAVFAAVVFLQTRLNGHDPSAAERAAMAILDLEKTRLRHSRMISGTAEPFDAPLKPLAPIDLPSDYVPGECGDDEEYDFDDELDEESEDDEFEEEEEDEDGDEDEEDEVVEDEDEPTVGSNPLKFTAKQRAEIERVFENYRLERIKCEQALREKAGQQPDIRILDWAPSMDGESPPNSRSLHRPSTEPLGRVGLSYNNRFGSSPILRNHEHGREDYTACEGLSEVVLGCRAGSGLGG